MIKFMDQLYTLIVERRPRTAWYTQHTFWRLSKAEVEALKICVLSRMGLFFLAILFDWTLADHKADAYQHQWKIEHGNLADQLIGLLASPFTKWDAQHFIALAMNGHYSDEFQLAFFPLYPWLLRSISFVIQIGCFGYLEPLSCIYLAAFTVNSISFCLSGILLHKICVHMLQYNRMLAYDVILIYAINPASVFFSAFYTESLFFAITVTGLWLLFKDLPLLASLVFGIGSYTRSNGKQLLT